MKMKSTKIITATVFICALILAGCNAREASDVFEGNPDALVGEQTTQRVGFPEESEVTGTFVHPLSSGRLTSSFGPREGRIHNGIDLAAPRGTYVIAADGGTVTFSGYRGATGNLIIINHGEGIETHYAHLNERHVSKGDEVYQGQHIGDVGSTGRTAGPHLHFEINVNGVPQNPFDFIPQ